MASKGSTYTLTAFDKFKLLYQRLKLSALLNVIIPLMFLLVLMLRYPKFMSFFKIWDLHCANSYTGTMLSLKSVSHTSKKHIYFNIQMQSSKSQNFRFFFVIPPFLSLENRAALAMLRIRFPTHGNLFKGNLVGEANCKIFSSGESWAARS